MLPSSIESVAGSAKSGDLLIRFRFSSGEVEAQLPDFALSATTSMSELTWVTNSDHRTASAMPKMTDRQIRQRITRKIHFSDNIFDKIWNFSYFWRVTELDFTGETSQWRSGTFPSNPSKVGRVLFALVGLNTIKIYIEKMYNLQVDELCKNNGIR